MTTTTMPANKLSSPVLATLVFVCSEVMFFAALISAYTIIKASSGNMFKPPAHITLPVAATALNMLVLCVSGLLLHLATSKFEHQRATALKLFAFALFGGAFFVAGQSYEWFKLISYGMKMTSGTFAACFFLLIGAHALHAAATVLIMGYFYWRRDSMTLENIKALRIFWLFVVAMFPILYWLVYL